jgi:hypothetical protein
LGPSMTLRHLAALAVLGVTGSSADAQQVWLSATAAQSSHHLLPDPSGPGAGVTWPLNDQLAARVGVFHFADRQTRTGSTCTGLVLDPAECVEERIDDRGAVGGVTLGVVATVVRRGRIALALVPSVSLVRVRAESRGEQTGRSLDASSPMAGVNGGVEVSVVPSARWPIAVRLGAHAGTLESSEEAIPDGYSPFARSIRLTRFEVGLSVWKPPAATAQSRKPR